MTDLRETLDKADQVKPIAEHNGMQIVTFADQRDIAVADMVNKVGLDTVQFNPDGTVARTPGRYAAVNPDHYYINRFKRVKDSIYVVMDYRAIQDLPSGSVYAKQIPAYVIKRDAEKKLVLDKVVTVSDTEFMSDFTHILSREAMAQIKPLLDAGVGVTVDDLGI